VHLADGIVSDPAVLLLGNLLGAGALGVAVARARLRCPRYAAWTGTLAAFVLAAQAINLPLLPGASAHVMGAGLLTLTLGPGGAALGLFVVLVAQALLLGDGGLTVLGINTLNIAILPVLAVSGARYVFGESRRGLMASAFVGTVLGNALAGSSLAAVLIFGAHAAPRLTTYWLVGAQSATGIVEGLLTALAVRHLLGAAPRLLRSEVGLLGPEALDHDAAAPGGAWARPLFRAAAVGLCVAVALLPFATSAPDALEVVLRHLEMSP